MQISQTVKASLTLLVVAACAAPSTGSEETTSDRLERSDCACALGQVCEATTRQCIARPVPQPGERSAEISLLTQVRLGDPSILGKLGKAEANFYAAEPLPRDDRPSFATSTGETCSLEKDSMYPYRYNGAYWPSGPSLGAGNLAFDVNGAAGAIGLQAFDSGEYGWAYFHGANPPALHGGGATYPDFFDPAFLTPGASVTVHNEAGGDIGGFQVTGDMPQDFTVTEPAIEQPNATARIDDGLHVRWSPPQPSAFMEVFVSRIIGSSFVLLSCKVKDSGDITIPPAALSTFEGFTGLQLRRTTERYAHVKQLGGALDVSLLGRNARVGAFMIAR